jgi:hypothetical protein
VAVATYTEAHDGQLPPAYVLGPDGRPWHSWRVLLLPYIEQQALHARYRFDEPWDGPNNRQITDQMPRTYAFSDSYKEGRHVANYLAVVGPETLWPGAKPFQGKPVDGSSNTILLVENYRLDVHWMEPRDLVFSDMSFELQHPYGVSSRYKTPAVVMADDSVRSLSPGIDPAALRAMLTANGREQLTDADGQWRVIEDSRDREPR